MDAFMHVLPEWLELISLTFCIGALVCRLLVFTPLAGAKLPAQRTVLTSMWRLFAVFLAVLFTSSICELLMRASEMSGQPIAAVFPVLPTVIFHTHAGGAWLVRMGALICLSIALIAGGRYRDSRVFLLFVLGFAALISMTESASGHASDKGDFSIPEVMDWLHLLAASVWGGGLLVLSIILLPALVRTGDQGAPLTAGIASRFSRIAGIAVGIIALTSIYNAWIDVGSIDAFWKSPYGRIVVAKIVLFFILLNLGALNRYINVPLLQRWGGFAPGRQGIISRTVEQYVPRFLLGHTGDNIALRFKRSVRIEAILVICVFLCASFLRHEIPARHAVHLGHHGGAPHPMNHHSGDDPHSPDNRNHD